MKRKCNGSGSKPIVERPFMYAVIHVCKVCGRTWNKNTLNNGWPDMPIPNHFLLTTPDPSPAPAGGSRRGADSSSSDSSTESER